MDEQALFGCFEQIEAALARVADLPSGAARVAEEALESVIRVYGEGLRRVVEAVRSEAPGAVASLARDDLVANLLLLHGLSGGGTEARVGDAIERIREVLEPQGTSVELTAFHPDTREVVVSLAGRAAAAAATRDAVEEALVAAAPDLSSVEILASEGVQGVPVRFSLRPPRPEPEPGGSWLPLDLPLSASTAAPAPSDGRLSAGGT